MSNPPEARSVKIGHDERTGWSSDRPRRDGAPPRPASLAVRGRVLAPSDRLRYTPGSLVLVASPDAEAAERFMTGVLEDRSALLSAAKVRRLLSGRVAEDELESRVGEVLDSAVQKRLDGGEAVVLIMEGFAASDRERWVRAAAGLRRPRHLVLLDGSAGEEARSALGDLRRVLMAGGLGEDGFHTAIRLGGSSATELNRIVFRSPPRDE
ncbi:MAG: hypothetical protein ACR2NB_05320 [Solirubrobacteraceae bacterium]